MLWFDKRHNFPPLWLTCTGEADTPQCISPRWRRGSCKWRHRKTPRPSGRTRSWRAGRGGRTLRTRPPPRGWMCYCVLEHSWWCIWNICIVIWWLKNFEMRRKVHFLKYQNILWHFLTDQQWMCFTGQFFSNKSGTTTDCRVWGWELQRVLVWIVERS